MEKKAILTLHDGRTFEFPVMPGTIGPDVIDIRSLYGKAKVFTYDPGFLSTASCNSSITYIDGDAGVLLYRGYPIEQLALKCDFLEVCYLLLNGELPDRKQRDEFVGTVTRHTMVHEQIARFYTGFRRDAHPMATMVGMVGALSAFYPNIDFYSGIVQRALGIPTSMFTCIFALARTVGWIAQWQEMIADPEYRIGRPRQLYRGTPQREVSALDDR